MGFFLIEDWAAWAPGLETREAWLSWAKGESQAREQSQDAPALTHLPPVARRRLSQLSRMVLEVGHQLCRESKPSNFVFCSQFGEIVQQKAITMRLLEEGNVRPAAFSLSVFNTPVSLLSIHEGLTGALSVLLAGKHILASSLITLLSRLEYGDNSRGLLLFADETLPEEYRPLTDYKGHAYAFGLKILMVPEKKACQKSGYIQYELEGTDAGRDALLLESPLDWLKWHLLGQKKTGLYALW